MRRSDSNAKQTTIVMVSALAMGTLAACGGGSPAPGAKNTHTIEQPDRRDGVRIEVTCDEEGTATPTNADHRNGGRDGNSTWLVQKGATEQIKFRASNQIGGRHAYEGTLIVSPTSGNCHTVAFSSFDASVMADVESDKEQEFTIELGDKLTNQVK